MLEQREGFQLVQFRLAIFRLAILVLRGRQRLRKLYFSRLRHRGKNLRGSKTRKRDPSFTASLAETKRERSVVLLQLGIYSLSTPTCTCLHALSRLGCVIFTCFIFAYHYECYEWHICLFRWGGVDPALTVSVPD